MIVFEGCDCAGKTTVARRVAEELMKRGRLHRFERYGILPEWWDYHYMYVRSCERWAVIDRFVVSEYVYGHHWRDGPNCKLTSKNSNIIGEAMRNVGALTVYVAPPYDMVADRLKKRGDRLVKQDDLAALMARYDTYLAKAECAITGTPVKRVTGVSLYDDVIGIVKAYLQIQRKVEAENRVRCVTIRGS